MIAKGQLLAIQEFRREKNRDDFGKVSVKEYYLSLRIKPNDGLCTGCGVCCQVTAFPEDLFEEMKKRINHPSTDNSCPMLGDNGCVMGYRGMIPLSCLSSDCSAIPECTERFVEVE